MIIQAFISRAIARLQGDLIGQGVPSVAIGPVVPASVTTKRLVVSGGKFVMPALFGDTPAGQQRTRGLKQSFPVNINNITGPYTLSQEPLEGTLSCRLIWNQAGDDLEGKKIRIYPRKNDKGDGFTIDFTTKQVSIFNAAPLSGSPSLEVEYSYVTIFSMREFEQIMSLESYAPTPDEAEKWAALGANILVSNTPALLQTSNASGNTHSSGNFLTEHLISQFFPTEGSVERISDNMFRYSVQFQIKGQVVLMRTMTESANIIDKIFSPGNRDKPGAINIEPNLD